MVGWKANAISLILLLIRRNCLFVCTLVDRVQGIQHYVDKSREMSRIVCKCKQNDYISYWNNLILHQTLCSILQLIVIFLRYVVRLSGNIKVYFLLLISWMKHLLLKHTINLPLSWQGLTYNKFPINIMKKASAYFTSRKWHIAGWIKCSYKARLQDWFLGKSPAWPNREGQLNNKKQSMCTATNAAAKNEQPNKIK